MNELSYLTHYFWYYIPNNKPSQARAHHFLIYPKVLCYWRKLITEESSFKLLYT